MLCHSEHGITFHWHAGSQNHPDFSPPPPDATAQRVVGREHSITNNKAEVI